MTKVVITFSQGSAGTQTVQGGLLIHSFVANFLWCMSAKNYEYQLTHDKVISKDKVRTFLRHSVGKCEAIGKKCDVSN